MKNLYLCKCSADTVRRLSEGGDISGKKFLGANFRLSAELTKTHSFRLFFRDPVP